MSTNTLMTVEEYLHTSFEDGDREYVDGEIVERNMGEWDHGKIQCFLGYLFLRMATQAGGLSVLTDIRVRINSTRYRIPDVAVWLERDAGADHNGIPVAAPFIVVEIFSPEDRMSRVTPKMEEYLSIGVLWVWLINPYKETAILYTPANPEGSPCPVLRTQNPEIEISLERVLQLQAD